MIRATQPSDTPLLVELTRQTEMFRPLELQALREVLDDYHATNQAQGHRCLTAEADGQVIGFAYFAPAAMTDGTWYLWWIAVAKAWQAKGIGGQLLRQVEHEFQQAQGRLLLIDTSSQPAYEPTRRFYQKHGYEVGAILKDFYKPGDDLVVFRKTRP
jgi:ribosomal protein S18 acetylase RimI-like enzyme